MRLLLDTHIALWAIADDARLPAQAAELIVDPANEVLVSVASLWEIVRWPAVVQTPCPSRRRSAAVLPRGGYELLDIVPPHVVAIEQLPRLHADPFDRLLIGQPLSVPLRLITHDDRLARYSDTPAF